jgi:RHS repeat-associated protein
LPLTTIENRYNGLGDRLQQTVDSVTTNFTLDLNNPLTQVLADGTNTYLYGLDRLSQSSLTTEYFLTDALGSVRQLTDASGEVQSVASYEPFGVPITNGASSYGFAGEWQDPTGLVFLRARFYSPVTGRFISRDPYWGYLVSPQTQQPYAYSGNNPVNLTDPTGKYIESPLDVAFLIFDAVALGIDASQWASGCANDALQRQTAIDAAALVIDLVFLALPGATGGGPLLRLALATGGHITVVGAMEIARVSYRAMQVEAKFMQFASHASNSSKHGHHPWPQYLGGPKKQDLYDLEDSVHREYHSQLDKYLDRKLGKSYFDRLFKTEGATYKMLDALLEFNENFDKLYGTHTYEALEDVLRNLGILNK